jgi:hypothetical protein
LFWWSEPFHIRTGTSQNQTTNQAHFSILFVMGPHPENINFFVCFIIFVNETVLNIDSTRMAASIIPP